MKTRYPGVRPFTQEEKDLFFGRNEDIQRFYNLISIEKMVVLYSKSGLGKSSLINAGIIPRLKAETDIQIFTIRFGGHSADTVFTPADIFVQRIQQQAQHANPLGKIAPNDDSFWYLFKNYQLSPSPAGGFTLIFDQFEELFTYPAMQVDYFKKQLAELLYKAIPAKFNNLLSARLNENPQLLTDQEIDQLYKPLNLRVIFVTRADRMSLLNNLSDSIPAILKRCYELAPLTRTQAQNAIIQPAEKSDSAFATPPFTYEPLAVTNIINFLTQNGEKEIETFQLQTICQYCENLVINLTVTNPQGFENLAGLGGGLGLIKAQDLGNLQSVFQSHYSGIIEKLPAENHLVARRFIENQLIQDERRISMDEVLCLRFVNKTVLLYLLNSHLLRSEPNTTSGFSYELCHDTMIAPVLKAKEIREKEELRIEELRVKSEELRVAKEKAENERIEREKERRRQRKIIAVVSFAALVSLLFGVFGFVMWQNADRQKLIANRQTVEAQQSKAEADKQKQKAFEALKEVETQKQKALDNELDAKKKEAIARDYAEKAKALLASFLGGKQGSMYALFADSAKVLYAKGEYDKALPIYNLAKNAPDLPTQNNLNELINTTEKQKALTKDADKLYLSHNFEKAKSIYAQILKNNATDTRNKQKHAQCLLFTEQLVKVDSGTFLMGSPDSVGESDEHPQHQVKLNTFYISKFEITNAQYACFLSEYGSNKVKTGADSTQVMIYEDNMGLKLNANQWEPQTGKENCPVVSVTWYGANEFCRFYGLSLPTEAEWEYAARGGVEALHATPLQYAGTTDSLEKYAWYSNNDEKNPFNYPSGTKPVGKLRPNQLGIYDMSGNVWEWCDDWHNSYSAENQSNPKGLEAGSYRVLRGGSWLNNASFCRVADRGSSYPNLGSYYCGFRPVRD